MATRKSKKSKSKAETDENSLNYTLNDSYWMDSFDKLMGQLKKPLRERNIFKRNIRASYNRDSSLENPSTDDEKGFDVVDLQVVASTPRFKSAPKTYTRGKQSLKPPKQTTDKPGPSKLSVPKFFNFVSTPVTRKSDKSLNLSVIVSSEGEPSIWDRVAFPNLSNFMQKKRIPDDEQMLKSPAQNQKKKTRATGKKQSTTAKGRKSEKPKVLFDLADDSTDEQKENSLVKVDNRQTENFVLKPGKWRKSIVNMRRTLNEAGAGVRPSTVAEAKRKQSVMFNIPEGDDNEGEEDAVERHTGRWTKGTRISQYHPGRRRKSIFIRQESDSLQLVDDGDYEQHNASKKGTLKICLLHYTKIFRLILGEII